MTSDAPKLRADLHVHSYHSGYASHLKFLRTRDCYSDPDDVYRVAKARGMDLVTITDHDHIAAASSSRPASGRAGFFISEEIECHMPGVPAQVHIGDHRHQRADPPRHPALRGNVFEAAAYLRRGVFFTLNHLFFFYRRQMPLEAYLGAMPGRSPRVQVRNGAMLRDRTRLIDTLLSSRALTGYARRQRRARSSEDWHDLPGRRPHARGVPRQSAPAGRASAAAVRRQIWRGRSTA
jgi:hypothetical protein